MLYYLYLQKLCLVESAPLQPVHMQFATLDKHCTAPEWDGRIRQRQGELCSTRLLNMLETLSPLIGKISNPGPVMSSDTAKLVLARCHTGLVVGVVESVVDRSVGGDTSLMVWFVSCCERSVIAASRMSICVQKILACWIIVDTQMKIGNVLDWMMAWYQHFRSSNLGWELQNLLGTR